MNQPRPPLKKVLEYVLPSLVLIVLGFFSYAKFYRHSYGLAWNREGVVSQVFVLRKEPTIHEGDRLVRVGQVSFEAFRRDLRQELFAGVAPGSYIPVSVERDGRLVTIDWQMPVNSGAERRAQLFDAWLLAYVFWVAGTLTLLSLRPRGPRWALLAAFNYITTIWLITGSGLSAYHIWNSALVFRAAMWMSLPIYLHLHWVFPRSLGSLPPPLSWLTYIVSAGFAAAQWFQLLPAGLYAVAFFASILGSLVLLVAHTVRQPDMRRELGLLLVAALAAVVPSLAAAVIAQVANSVPSYGPLTLVSFPILPLTYLYAAYRSQLGGLEVRVNRLISMYMFMIGLGTIIIPILIMIYRIPQYSIEQPLIIGIFASAAVAALSLGGYPAFEAFIERRVLGIALPSSKLQQAYSAHITSSASFAELTRVLDEDVLPSLLIRQFVFVLLDNETTKVLLSRGVTEDQLPGEAAWTIPGLFGEQNRASGVLKDPRYSWIKLALPLTVQDHVLGLWLFGRRDPDDLYARAEMPALQLLANQTAIALSNILQSERLRSMYQANIDRHENERLSLARDLHDSVLSELAGMLMNTDVQMLPKSFQEGYQVLTGRLREIVSELRPPMLNYGLKLAIEELADNLMERSSDAVDITVDLESDGQRYPVDKEQHLYRIVQEACDNAVRHSKGKNVRVSGRLAPDCAEITIEDDGKGFMLGKDSVQLYDLLSQRHFGLAGMLERAELIDAEIQISSTPGGGTRVELRWRSSRDRRPAHHGLVDSSS